MVVAVLAVADAGVGRGIPLFLNVVKVLAMVGRVYSRGTALASISAVQHVVIWTEELALSRLSRNMCVVSISSNTLDLSLCFSRYRRMSAA